jgi:hypothetical protein
MNTSIARRLTVLVLMSLASSAWALTISQTATFNHMGGGSGSTPSGQASFWNFDSFNVPGGTLVSAELSFVTTAHLYSKEYNPYSHSLGHIPGASLSTGFSIASHFYIFGPGANGGQPPVIQVSGDPVNIAPLSWHTFEADVIQTGSYLFTGSLLSVFGSGLTSVSTSSWGRNGNGVQSFKSSTTATIVYTYNVPDTGNGAAMLGCGLTILAYVHRRRRRCT